MSHSVGTWRSSKTHMIYEVEIIPDSYLYRVCAKTKKEAKEQAIKYLQADVKADDKPGKVIVRKA